MQKAQVWSQPSEIFDVGAGALGLAPEALQFRRRLHRGQQRLLDAADARLERGDRVVAVSRAGQRARGLLLAQVVHQLGDLRPLPRAEQPVHARHLVGDLRAIALRGAARGDRATGRAACRSASRCSAASDSPVEACKKPQVLTISTSASSGRAASA